MIIDWNNYRVYFKKIEKQDTDVLTYTLMPKKINLEKFIAELTEYEIEKYEGRQDETPKSGLRNVIVMIENSKLQKASLMIFKERVKELVPFSSRA